MKKSCLALCVAVGIFLCGTQSFAVLKEGVRFVWDIEYVKPVVEQEKALSGGTVVARETAVPPKVDGILDEDCWKNATSVKNFLLYQTDGKLASVKTEAKFVFTRDALYVGFVCDEPDMKGLVTDCLIKDGNVWYDDCVELWLDVNFTREDSFHILVNPLGTIADLREEDRVVDDPLAIEAGTKKIVHNSDAKWDSHAIVKTSLGSDSWVVEMKIPVKGLELDEIIRGSVWGLNVARTRRSGGFGELSSWTGVFITPISRFGILRLDEPEYDFQILSSGNMSRGKNLFSMRVRNMTQRTKRIQVEMKATSKVVDRKRKLLSLAGGEEQRFSFPYLFSGIGQSAKLFITATDIATKKKVFSRTLERTISEPILFSLGMTELYLQEKTPFKGFVTIALGDEDLKNVTCEIALLDPSKRVISVNTFSRIENPQFAMFFDISSLTVEGAYGVRLRLLDKKKVLAESVAEFMLSESPF